jgi:folate-dependent tRNA-U54 methylase TrmFO/GidA
MNINFGLFPPIEKSRGAEKGLARKAAISLRAARDLDNWMGAHLTRAAE